MSTQADKLIASVQVNGRSVPPKTLSDALSVSKIPTTIDLTFIKVRPCMLNIEMLITNLSFVGSHSAECYRS